MDRRTFLSALGLLAAPLAAEAQQAGRIFRLGMLFQAAPVPSDQSTSAFLIPAALRELGYLEGQNLVIERRYAEGKTDRLPGLARDLVQLRVDVIVTAARPPSGRPRMLCRRLRRGRTSAYGDYVQVTRPPHRRRRVEHHAALR